MTAASIRERPLLICLAFVQFTNVLDFMIMMPLSPIFVKEFGISHTQFGFLVASYNISAGIVSLLSSFFIDRFDRRKVMLFAYFFFILGTFACGLSPTFGLLLLARILTGMFGGVLAAILLSIVGDVVPFQRRASAIGLVMTGFAAASVLGVPIASFAASHFNWHVPFFAIGIMGLIVFAGIFFLIPSMTGHIAEAKLKNPFRNILEIISSSNRLRGLLLMSLLMMGHFSIISTMPDYMVFNVGITQKQVSLIYLVGGVCSFFVLRLVGKLCDRFGSFKIFACLSVLALFPIFAVTNLPQVGIVAVLCVTSFIFIFGGSRSVPVNTLNTATAEPRQRGGFLSLNAATQQLSAGIATFLGGILISEGPHKTVVNYHHVGWLAAAASLIAIPVAYFVRPVNKKVVDDHVILETAKATVAEEIKA
jgi:DHA1 family inner membrane transport protein